ncbi:MAG: tetratricopeptide repeat protein [Bacteroidetes bacterium]|nr:MAG: tetratricopeptide repeat protein [Bacteroidota bacterium]TAG90244.1 MAG: tetratricopeptide repeat protein [Bacteroidota bacterium]
MRIFTIVIIFFIYGSGEILSQNISYTKKYFKISKDSVIYKNKNKQESLLTLNLINDNLVKLNNRGAIYAIDKEYSKALHTLNECVKLGGLDTAYHNRGILQMEKNNFLLSIHDLVKSNQNTPENQYNIAFANYKIGKYTDSYKIFENISEDVKFGKTAFFGQILSLYKNNLFGKVSKMLDSLSLVNTSILKQEGMYAILAHANMMLKNIEKAKKYYKQNMSSFDKNFGTLQLLCEEGKIKQANKKLEYTQKKFTDCWENIYFKGLIAYKSGIFSMASFHWSKLVSIQNENPYIQNSIATTYFRTKEYDKAENYYEKAINILPNYVEAINGLAMTKFVQGNYYGAYPYTKKLINLDTTLSLDDGTYLTHAYICQINKQENEESIFIEKAIRKNPNSPLVDIFKGLKSYAQKDYSSAESYFIKGLAIDSTALAIHNYLGFARFFQAKYDLALSNFNKVLKVEPNNLYALNGKALTLMDKEEYKKSIKVFEYAQSIYPKNAELYNNSSLVFAYFSQTWQDNQKDSIQYYTNRAYQVLDSAKIYKINPLCYEINKGNIKVIEEKYQEAVNLYQTQNTQFGKNNEGIVYALQEAYLDAQNLFLEATKLDSNYAVPYWNKTIVSENSGIYNNIDDRKTANYLNRQDKRQKKFRKNKYHTTYLFNYDLPYLHYCKPSVNITCIPIDVKHTLKPYISYWIQEVEIDKKDLKKILEKQKNKIFEDNISKYVKNKKYNSKKCPIKF